jgi:cell division protein FtsZ
MVFITAGMGGGTGTGAAPIIAKAARERGILTVGVVTKPFHFEGRHRMRLSDAGVAELQRYVDTLIVIPNQNLFRVANERTTFAEAFAMADQVLHSGVRSITDLMVMPGLINLDFADVRSVMTEMGKAMMGTGEAAGEDRALMASQNAIANPLLDEVSLKGARAVLVNVTGGLDMTLLEVDEAANAISSEVDPDANIIFGAAFDPALEGRMRVSVVATGMDAAVVVQPETIGRFQTPRPALQPAAATPAPAARTIQASAATSSRYARTAEPTAKTAPDAEPQSDATVWPEPARAPEPLRAEAPLEARTPEPRVAAAEPPVIRIIDPSVEDDNADVYGGVRSGYDARRAGPAPLNNEPRQKGGWLSLFGGSRPRDETPLGQTRSSPPARSAVGGGSAQPAPQQAEPQDAADDLEIPSFLRRLAN